MRSIALSGLVGALTVFAFAGCGSDERGEDKPRANPRPVVVDTDAGLDDAIAILYFATSPEVDLRAVTVSGTGLAHCFPGARNVVGLLELAGRPDVPVSCGPAAPLGADDPFRPFPEEWRRVADSRYGSGWPIGRGDVDDRPAAELLAEAVEASEAPVTLVTLGPLTNVAAALARDDGFPAGVERVVAMGGAFDVPGNTANAEPPPVRDVAEWNIYADPQSARDVVDSGLPVRFVPLDATNGVPVDAYVLRAAARAPSTDAIAVVSALLAGVHGLVSAGDYYLWDPLAAVLAVQPELGTLERRSVDVITDGAEAGRTVTAAGDGAPVEVFTGADGRAAEAALLSGLSGSHVAMIDERPDVVIDPGGCTTGAAELAAGSVVIEVEGAATEQPSNDAGVALGNLDPGRGVADIEAFFAAPARTPPDWFTVAAVLGTGVDAPSTDLVRLSAGDYTVVCVRRGPGAMEFVGTTSLTVR